MHAESELQRHRLWELGCSAETAIRGVEARGKEAERVIEQIRAGDRFTVADITAYCAIEFAKFCELDIPDNCVDVARWFDAVAARPSAKA